MRQLSSAGEQTINDIAQRHGYSTDAVRSMLESVINGNGSMAQFSHPEFAGSGQWMRGGMIMVSDMFNNHLKGRIDSLCSELSNLIANQPDLVRTGSFQSQSQGGQAQANHAGGNTVGSFQQQSGSGPTGAVSLFVPPAPGTSGDWWPADLRQPASVGSQNGSRYAYFAQAGRLAIESNGRVTVYDTLDHRIGGFSQQQSTGGSMSFNSQHGLIDVASLPVVSTDGVATHENASDDIARESPARNPSAQNTSASKTAASDTLASDTRVSDTRVSDSATSDTRLSDTQARHAPAPGPATKHPQDTATDTRPVASATMTSNDILTTIEKLADLCSKGILDKAEYDAKKAELLSRL